MTHAVEYLPHAIALHQSGALDDAERCYRQILDAIPEHVETLYWLGCLKLQMGDAAQSTVLLGQAVKLSPRSGEIYLALGNSFFSENKLSDAISAYHQAAQWSPESYEVFANLGTAFNNVGAYQEAIAACKRAIELRPDLAETHYNLGRVLLFQGELRLAIDALQRSLAMRPDFVEAIIDLGTAHGDFGEMQLAVGAFRQATELRPDSPMEFCYLGEALQSQGDLVTAAIAFRRANDLDPGCGESKLVNVMQHLCDWRDLEELSLRVIERLDKDVLLNNARPYNPFDFLVLATPTTAAQQLKCAKAYLRSMGLDSTKSSPNTIPFRGSARPSKLRVGYLSADFCEHATAYLIAELFERHDRRRFEIYGYSMGIDDASPIRRRIDEGLDQLRDIRLLSHFAATQRIADDKIDILVDLKGYTHGAQTQILAARPAPIQVNYLGYPGTMGADFIDYVLVDDFVVPVDQQPYFSERLVHLPGCYQVNDSTLPIKARTPTRNECGLPEDGVVLCSFNNSYKFTPKVFDIWMRLLRSYPKSSLWLLASNPYAAENLMREAEQRGVAADRLVFAPKLPLAEHLARHRVADLFLDSFPVNAHTTASDALRMGLPILTLSGNTFISRVAGSLLRSVGLPELITYSYDDYESTARHLLENPGQLKQYRMRLASNLESCGVFDCQAFARKIEKAYEMMWDSWQQK